MKAFVSVLNASFLFWAMAIYMGTGWSMWLFSFPIVPQLTPENYYYVFVPQVAYATKFFTPLTWIMMACALLMLILEWKGGIRWVPVIVLLLVGIAGWVTVQFIFPYHREMTAGIHDPFACPLLRWRLAGSSRSRSETWSKPRIYTTGPHSG